MSSDHSPFKDENYNFIITISQDYREITILIMLNFISVNIFIQFSYYYNNIFLIIKKKSFFFFFIIF